MSLNGLPVQLKTHFWAKVDLKMSSGLIATIVVLALVGIFGLIILWDRKKTALEEATPKRGAEVQMSPKERWDTHVEELQKRDS